MPSRSSAIRVHRVCALAMLALSASGCPTPPVPADAGRADSGIGVDGGIAPDTAPAVDADERFDAPPDDAAGATVTTIRVRYAGRPGAITLRGGGGPLSWDADAPATVDGTGELWTFTTTEITAPIEWKPRLGDLWARGPNYHVAPGDTIEVSPHFEATPGRLVTIDDAFGSSLPGGGRLVTAYLPPGYDENTAARWPVVYAQDGQNLFDPGRAFGGNEWEVDETLDAAAETGHCGDPSGSACSNDGECGAGERCDAFHGAIVVGIDNSAARIDEYTPTVDSSVGSGGDADAYLAALVDELRPEVDAMLRTRGGADSTAILGSSLGGLLAAHASVVRPADFGVIVAMSPSTWWDGREILDEIPTIPSAGPRPERVYVDSGDSGASMDGVLDTADLAAAYEAVGYAEGSTLRYLVAPGHQHSEPYWAIRLPGALSFALGPREEHVAP